MIPVKHCLFHLGQSVYRKVQNKGFAHVYGQNEQFRIAIRSLPALAFLENEEVIPAFNVLRAIAPQEAEQFYEYFQKFYIHWFRFILAMKIEEEYQNNRLMPYEIAPTRGIADRPRLRKYIENDEAIKSLVNAYDAKENKNDEDILRHINALQFRIGMKGFENWN
uniref:Thioredoxin n=1 Tax=Meloidogyne hapla TaxID=6305 RepID=A0A1I8BQF3_MELHA